VAADQGPVSRPLLIFEFRVFECGSSPQNVASLTFQNVLTNIFLVLRCYIDVFNAAPLPLLPSITFENVSTNNLLLFKCFVLFFTGESYIFSCFVSGGRGTQARKEIRCRLSKLYKFTDGTGRF